MPTFSHLVLTGIPGTSLTGAVLRRLERLAPGGVVLFRRNIGTLDELERLTRDLRGALGPRTLVAVDQEGGRVARLREPFSVLPPMRVLGDAGRADLARATGRILGRELAAAGFNADFAPVLDVDSNPDNPVIGDRAFSADPTLVARLGLALAAGIEEGGVLPCGKHFPGHGDSALDSHLALPQVEATRQQLDERELRPFRAAVRARIPMLMSAHVLYPALDPDHVATLSRRILRDLLRDRLRFRGVVVSDDLAMHALDGAGTPAEVAVAALDAGCDWLLACQSLDDGECVAEALEGSVRRYRSIEAASRSALRRITLLRKRLATLPAATEPLRSVLARAEGPALVRRIAEAAASRTSRGAPAQRD